MGKGSLAKKIFLKQDQRGKVAANMYTGKKLANAPFLIGGAAVGGLSMMDAGKALNGTNYENSFVGQMSLGETISRMQPRVGTIERGEAAPFMADGGSATPNLGATGDIVLGLHNQRRGQR